MIKFNSNKLAKIKKSYSVNCWRLFVRSHHRNRRAQKAFKLCINLYSESVAKCSSKRNLPKVKPKLFHLTKIWEIW